MRGGAGAHTPEITQADRDRLADYYAIKGVGDSRNRISEDVRRGFYEDPLLRAFAQHRIDALAGIPTDALPDLMGEVRDIVEAIAPVVSYYAEMEADLDPYGGDCAALRNRMNALLAKLPVQP